jgi:hypothetical protein
LSYFLDGQLVKLQVIRDDDLVGGTKQRALYKLLESMLVQAEKDEAECGSSVSSSDDSDAEENEGGITEKEKKVRGPVAINEFVFTGSITSFIQVALALCCNRLKKRV